MSNPERLHGAVSRRVVRRGTASEHAAVVLRTDQGEELILQRVGANPFDDAETGALVGRSVAVEGHRLGKVFRYRRVDV